MRREFVENELRHRYRPLLTALGLANRMINAELFGVVGNRQPTPEKLNVAYPQRYGLAIECPYRPR